MIQTASSSLEGENIAVRSRLFKAKEYERACPDGGGVSAHQLPTKVGDPRWA